MGTSNRTPRTRFRGGDVLGGGGCTDTCALRAHDPGNRVGFIRPDPLRRCIATVHWRAGSPDTGLGSSVDVTVVVGLELDGWLVVEAAGEAGLVDPPHPVRIPPNRGGIPYEEW